MQAQIPNSPSIGLWSRLEALQPGNAFQDDDGARAVRAALMRGTLHLCTARDYLSLRPLVQPVLTRGLNGNFGRHLKGSIRAWSPLPAAGCSVAARQRGDRQAAAGPLAGA